MSRVIKFRVWNPYAKAMYPAEHFAIQCSDGSHFQWMPECEHYKAPFIENNAGNLVLMQFTGLLDRHGKEIYEGDVVKGRFSQGTVTFENGRFIGQSKYDGQFHINSDEDEILGNIYEQPELVTRPEGG